MYQAELAGSVRIHRMFPPAQDFHSLGVNLVPRHVFVVFRNAVAHDVHGVSVDGKNPVHHVSAAGPGSQVEKDDVVGPEVPVGLLQDDEVLAAADKREHAVSLDGDGHPLPLIQHLQDVGEERIVVDDHLFHRAQSYERFIIFAL